MSQIATIVRANVKSPVFPINRASATRCT